MSGEPGQTPSEPAQRKNPPQRLDGVRVLVLFGGSELFGAERANIEVFRSLSELGLQARFITHEKFGGAQIEPELERLGISWTRAPFGTLWARWLIGRAWYLWFSNFYGLLVTNWIVWREANRWRATHLYAMNAAHYSYAALAMKWSRLPVVYRAGDEFPQHNFIYRWTARAIARRADVFVCISGYIRKACMRAGVLPEKLRVIYNHPPARAVETAATLPDVPAGAVVVTFIGQLAAHKGVNVLLEAAEIMLRAGRNVVFWMVGKPSWDEDEFEAIKKHAADSGLSDRIVFWGYQDRIAAILERTDIHVCPSLFQEPLSNVVVEAKQHGKPSVIFPSGGLPELVEHGVDGYICEQRDAQGLAAGIEFFLVDAERRVSAGIAARRSLEEKFGQERFKREWAEVFLATGRATMAD